MNPRLKTTLQHQLILEDLAGTRYISERNSQNPNSDKQADLAGSGVSIYEAVSKRLPQNYKPLQSPMERMKALFEAKRYIEENLCKELNLQMVQVPLIVDRDSGANDYLDRDGSRTPIEFPCRLGLETPIAA